MAGRPTADRLDELTLYALGRVPRCEQCPRYHGLLDLAGARRVLAAVPDYCTYQICAPLVARFERAAENTPLRLVRGAAAGRQAAR